MKNILSAFTRNTVFANILLILFFLIGIMATMSMIRETFPEFSLDMITVSVAYPGADPEEVEEGICQKLEEAIEGLEGVKQFTTESSENYASMLIEVSEDYDVNYVLDRARSKIDSISTFPQDAEKPVITELKIKESVIVLYLSGDMSEKRLKEWGENIKDELQSLKEISQVQLFGTREYEIAVEVSEQKLREYSLTFSDVSEIVQRSNLNLAGGTIRTEGEEIRIRTIGRKYTGDQLSSIVVKASKEGDLITLDRIATIKDSFSEDPIYAKINGKPVVFVLIMKTQEQDALVISKAAKNFAKTKQKSLPEGLGIKTLYDSTEMLSARINLLLKNGAIGLCLVFFLLWLFMDMRLSFWCGMGIPVSLAGAMGIMWAIGATINMISLFGLIMVLGIVVDDAIVVGESIYNLRQEGKKCLQAAIDGVSEVGMPVISAVITTIVAFIPLAYIAGIMGKFISILPTVVISCLLISLIECLFLLPAHLSHLPDPNISYTNPIMKLFDAIHRFPSNCLLWFIDNIYEPFLSKAIKLRYISLCIAISTLLIVIGFVKAGILKFQVFPEIDGFIITSTVEFPNGTPVEITQNAVNQIESAFKQIAKRTKTLSGEPMLKDILTLAGQTIGDRPQTGSHLGSVQVILLESEKRGVHAKDLQIMWEKELGPIPGVKSLTFEGMKAGPPGAPIEIWIQGHDMKKILAASDDLKLRLKKFDGVYQIRSDFNPGKNEMRLTLKPEARALGLTVSDLARQIYAGYYGQEAVRIQRGRDDIRVRVRYTSDERKNISDIERIRIRTKTGDEVPLISVANISFSPGYSTITRTDGLRRVVVSAAIDSKKANASEIFATLSKSYFSELKNRYSGIYIALQGEQKKMRESLGSLMIGFPLAIVGIFIIIATMFRSYLQPFVILITVPFGIIGAILGHMILGYNLSMMSMFGMVALTGVVVNDAIVLIERINENLALKMSFYDSIISAGKRRFRAIILTTFSTIGGLAPLIMETDFQARFLIPMAISIAGGVGFATLLTLLLIPSLLVILNDFRLVFYWLKNGKTAKREILEPARLRHNK